ncbi:hypothetical protein QBC33DRAFT_561799 [Phialemonium atrogriseum]|uniref:MEI5 protein n=1 Tax=Phialemonium atrogriseum TaxID=1093897 RepID=A0AAJ0BWM0_9PEZI|nr:uncharacterized protein QBC33DRAFT_561799 [Phialemonium atrogriseum]KAK1764407.1 hypothetical protein QBC33DRAFT_561799 [Phialemonium atrogriseum]
MADNKKKAAVAADDAASSSRASSKASKFSEKLAKFGGLMTDLKNDTAGALEFEKTVENQKTLSKTLKARDEEIKALKTEIEKLEHDKDVLAEIFGKKHREYDDKLKEDVALKSAVSKSEDSLKAAIEEARSLRSENKELKANVDKLATSLEKLKESSEVSQTECDRLNHALGLSDANFEQLSRFVGEGRLIEFSPEDLARTLEEFASKCHDLAVASFGDNAVLTPSFGSFVEHLDRCLEARKAKLPLPSSMDKSARLMRCAAAEFIISSALVNYVFTDIYLPEMAGAQNAISTTLQLMAPRRESIVRCQLLAEFEATDETTSRIVEIATNEVCSTLNHLLPAGRARDDLQQMVRELFNGAVAMWRPLQKSKDRVIVEFLESLDDLERGDRHVDYDEGSLTGSTGQTKNQNGQAVLPLFPQISVKDIMLIPGIALWSDQAAFIEARMEMDRLSFGRSAGPQTSRPPVTRRRMSSSGTTARGSQSPPTKGSALFAQLDGTMSGASPASNSRNHVNPSSRVGNGVKAG